MQQGYMLNKTIAENYTAQVMGVNGLNDKSDTFRHAFFNAINTRDCTADPLGLPPLSASQIVRLFAITHESEVPTQLALEKEMDLFNNEVGISYCWNCFSTSSSSIANAIKTKLDNGELKYIKPLNFALSPSNDANQDGVQDCTTCLNGILPSSYLAFTNQ